MELWLVLSIAGAVVGFIAGFALAFVISGWIEKDHVEVGFMIANKKLYKVVPATAEPIQGNAGGGAASTFGGGTAGGVQ